jgi:ABC-2 type transport system ATP-binding protein
MEERRIMSQIETKRLTKRFGTLTAVNQLSFEVEEGEIFGLLGPNGAGKTTTIRMLAGLIAPTDGGARVGDYEINQDAIQIRAHIGLLTENPSLYDRLTGYENMEFFAEAYGLSNPQERKQRIRELLDFFELWDRRHDKVGTFSKGMKQKLALARALVHSPPILYLDEPTSGLDPSASKNIRDLMERLSRQEKRTILLSTHRLEDAERLCNRVLIINQGKSIIIGTPEELQDKITGDPILQVRLTQVTSSILEAVRGIEHVTDVQVDNAHTRLYLTVKHVKTTIPIVVRTIVNAEGQVHAVQMLRPSLEEAYIKLVQEEEN